VRTIVLALTLIALVAGLANAEARTPPFTTRDAAHARALLKTTLTGSDPREWVRCTLGAALTCRRYGKPALAKRYYLDTFVWERSSGRLTLTYSRGGRIELIAIVRGISASSFLIERVLYHR